MGKVILIGGSPMVGKSTVATLIASKLQCPCISTDDIGEVLQTIADINPMQGKFYLDYYAFTPKNKLISDIQQYHKYLEPAIRRLIDIHSTWGGSLIIEGWALYPCLFDEYKNDNIFSFWLIAESGLLENRLKNNVGFYNGYDSPDKVIENYIARSVWHNNILFEQCKLCGGQFYFVSGNELPHQLADYIIQSLA